MGMKGRSRRRTSEAEAGQKGECDGREAGPGFWPGLLAGLARHEVLGTWVLSTAYR